MGTISNAQRYKINPELERRFLNKVVFILKILPAITKARIKYAKTSNATSGIFRNNTNNENTRIKKEATEKDITKKQFHLLGLIGMICFSKRILFTTV